MSSVTKLVVPNGKKPSPAKAPSRQFRRKMQRQAASGVGIGVVAVALTALSLSHLAHGIEIVTGSATWESWAMAIGIDVGFIAMEIATLSCATEKLAKAIGRYTRPGIIGTMLGSAAMNAFAFAAAATGYMVAPAIVLGVAIPGLVYALTRVGTSLYIDCNTRGA